MLNSYLQLALRSFRKHRLHSAITILGLALGLMTSLLALMFVVDENSYDKFHSRLDRMYRLNKINTSEDGSTISTAETSGMMGPTMVDEFPEVDAAVRYQPWYNAVVFSQKDRHVELAERDVLMVDSTFFKVFDFELTRGSDDNVLTRPGTIVLTEGLAASLFAQEDPVGRTIIGINNLEFEVTGIVKEAPRNSHIQFKALVSWSSTVPNLGAMPFEWMNNWISQGITTYLLLKPGANADAVQSKLPKFMQDHLPQRVDRYTLYLQKFADAYLDAAGIRFHGMARTGSRDYVLIFSVIAGFILFIACVNYINISTSKATRRAREVGLRKSVGATRRQLINQFLGESLIITLLSAIIALCLLYLAVPFFNTLSGKTLPIEHVFNPMALSGWIVLIAVASLFSGLYPAFVLSSFKPSEVLKSNARSKISGHWPRQLLITFQFAIAIAMIAGTLLVYQQMKFVYSKNLGFDKEHVLVVNLTTDMLPKGPVFQEEVNQHPAVESSSLGRMALGFGGASTRVQPEGFPPDQVEVRMFPVDGNFLTTYDLSIVQGRFFDLPAQASDSNAVIINETLARKLNWDNPIGKTIKFDSEDTPSTIIGVLKDFHFASLYDDVDPLVMWVSRGRRNLSVRFTGNPKDLLVYMEEKWKLFEHRYPFKYTFVDDAFEKAYQSEERLFQTVVTFAGLSLFVACLGLYGLVSFTLEQRTKELGIRKVMGATVMGLNMMVNRKFLVLVVISSIVAVPVIIPMMKDWLNKFAFKIELGAGVFIIAITVTALITLIAVSIQAIRAAMMNPAETLRVE